MAERSIVYVLCWSESQGRAWALAHGWLKPQIVTVTLPEALRSVPKRAPLKVFPPPFEQGPNSAYMRTVVAAELGGHELEFIEHEERRVYG